MGNYVARNCGCDCIATWPPTENKQKKRLERTIMVVHPAEERVVEVGGGAPLTVAEVMFDFPGHFLLEYWPAAPLHWKRAIALPADEQAYLGRVYVLLPMHRLYARISPHESALCESLLRSSCRLPPPAAARNWPRKKNLHNLLPASSSAKVAPLSASSLPQQQHVQETTVFQPAYAASQLPQHVENDLLLQQFSSASADGRSFPSINRSLARSKSWMPRLQTIDESSTLAR